MERKNIMSDNPQTLFPIRELSELTQVNTVTIRAWERRYGLLKPQRTAKGHRLYCTEDVERVKTILAYMAKGVPVSKVKALLAGESTQASQTMSHQEENDSDWSLMTQQLQNTLASHNLNKIRDTIRELMLNYPVNLCYQRIIEPVSKKLTATTGTSISEQAAATLLHNAIIEYCILRLNTKAAKKSGASVVLICADQSPVWKLALTAIMLNDANFSVIFINQSCTLISWFSLVKQYGDSTCVVFQEGVWRAEDSKKIKAFSAQQDNLLLCGTAATLAGIDSQKSVPNPESILSFLTKGQASDENSI